MSAYVKQSIENDKLQLTGPSWDTEDYSFKNRPKLKATARNNNGQFVIFPSHPKEKGKYNSDGKHLHNQPIYMGFGPGHYRGFLEDFLYRIRLNKPFKRKLDNYLPAKTPDGSRGKQEQASALWYGVTEKGQPFIEVIAKDRPTCYFDFVDDYWHKISNPNQPDETGDRPAQGRFFAVGLIASWIDLFAATLYHEHKQVDYNKPSFAEKKAESLNSAPAFTAEPSASTDTASDDSSVTKTPAEIPLAVTDEPSAW